MGITKYIMYNIESIKEKANNERLSLSADIQSKKQIKESRSGMEVNHGRFKI